jgi:hypothetical protein
MKLSEVKSKLKNLSEVVFELPNGNIVPKHFHVTEVGKITKKFIDCGGTVREENVINFQLWEANDYDHRLAPEKLINIIELSEKVLLLDDLTVEVEYQSETIGKYLLDFESGVFKLKTTQTDCLAKDNCGIPAEKIKVKMADLQKASASCCTPNSGCC